VAAITDAETHSNRPESSAAQKIITKSTGAKIIDIFKQTSTEMRGHQLGVVRASVMSSVLGPIRFATAGLPAGILGYLGQLESAVNGMFEIGKIVWTGPEVATFKKSPDLVSNFIHDGFDRLTSKSPVKLARQIFQGQSA
jgi:hypothetical protein